MTIRHQTCQYSTLCCIANGFQEILQQQCRLTACEYDKSKRRSRMKLVYCSPHLFKCQTLFLPRHTTHNTMWATCCTIIRSDYGELPPRKRLNAHVYYHPPQNQISFRQNCPADRVNFHGPVDTTQILTFMLIA